MGWLDRILGRAKSTMGEAVDSPSMKQEGHHQEAAAQAEERAEAHEELAQEARETEAAERAEEERA